MSHSLAKSPPIWACSLLVLLSPCLTASGQTVWTGLTVSFSKPDGADPTDPEFQDRITDNVILTRANTRGLYNIAQETEYQFPMDTSPSPIDTEWATAINNEGKTIGASNWADLEFVTWRDAYGGGVGITFNMPAVVHLITDDVYLDLQITSWTSSFGGGFSYMRATGDLPPPPGTNGDYNNNGVVDAADYVVWRDTLDQTADPAGSGADGNESGVIDQGDYDFWKARFGNIVAPGSGATAGSSGTSAIPESTSFALFGFVISSLSVALRRRPSRRRSFGGKLA